MRTRGAAGSGAGESHRQQSHYAEVGAGVMARAAEVPASIPHGPLLMQSENC